MQKENKQFEAAVHAVQAELLAAMRKAGVSMSQAAPVLGYENKSSVSRTLVKYKIPAADVFKLMVLAKCPAIKVAGCSIRIKAVNPSQVEALLDALRDSVLVEQSEGGRKVLKNGLTWTQVAEFSGYNTKDMARYAWVGDRYHLPFFLILCIVKMLGASPHGVTVGDAALTIAV